MGSDCLNLDLAAEWQRSCLIRQARWETCNAREGLTVNTIDCVVVVDVGERDVDRDELVQGEAGGLRNAADIRERLLELFLDRARLVGAGRGIERGLAGDETEAARDDGGRKGQSPGGTPSPLVM